MCPTNDPATAAESDGGDDVQRRFRYQANFSALKALHLLGDNPELQAVYCEQIEDVLLEPSDGVYIAIQIKTREIDQPHLKATDESVWKALCKFCALDSRYPGKFLQFNLVTNFVFYRGTGPDDLHKLCSVARDAEAFALLGPRSHLRRKFVQLQADTGLSLESVVGTIAKTVPEEKRTAIEQLEYEIVQAISELPAYSGLAIARLRVGARLLRDRVWEASSLTLPAVLPSHSPGIDAHLDRLRVAGKRVDADAVGEILSLIPSRDVEEELLSISGFIERNTFPPGLGRMELKMAGAAISYADMAEMKDDVATLEATFVRWKEQYGLREANRRLAHIERFALQASRESRPADEALADFGPQALRAARAAVAEIVRGAPQNLFGCQTAHLTGAIGLLAEECKVDWRARRDAS